MPRDQAGEIDLSRPGEMPEQFALVPRRYGDRIDFPVHHAGMLAHLLGMGLQCGHITDDELMVAIVRVAEHETDGLAAPDRDAAGNEPHRARERCVGTEGVSTGRSRW